MTLNSIFFLFVLKCYLSSRLEFLIWRHLYVSRIRDNLRLCRINSIWMTIFIWQNLETNKESYRKDFFLVVLSKEMIKWLLSSTNGISFLKENCPNFTVTLSFSFSVHPYRCPTKMALGEGERGGSPGKSSKRGSPWEHTQTDSFVLF